MHLQIWRLYLHQRAALVHERQLFQGVTLTHVPYLTISEHPKTVLIGGAERYVNVF